VSTPELDDVSGWKTLRRVDGGNKIDSRRGLPIIPKGQAGDRPRSPMTKAI